jgi:hypothetical protein
MQNEFDFSEPDDVPSSKKKTIMERFQEFHGVNPHVYPIFVEMAQKASRNGTRKCSIAMLFEVLRWRTNVEIERTDEFKISNCLRAPYARFIMLNNPELEGIFDIKLSEVDEHFA